MGCLVPPQIQLAPRKLILTKNYYCIHTLENLQNSILAIFTQALPEPTAPQFCQDPLLYSPPSLNPQNSSPGYGPATLPSPYQTQPTQAFLISFFILTFAYFLLPFSQISPRSFDHILPYHDLTNPASHSPSTFLL